MYFDDEARIKNSNLVWREVSGAPPFRFRDVKDRYGLILRFWHPGNAVTQKLRQEFSAPAQDLMNKYDGISPPEDQMVREVLRELNRFIEGPCIYDERLFAEIELTDETRALIAGTVNGFEELRLNRILLEAVCYPAVARSRGFAQNYLRLTDWAAFLLKGKEIHGEANGEGSCTPGDVASATIAKLADEAKWQPEQSAFLTFARIVMRSIVSHELSRKWNGSERISNDDEECYSDSFAGQNECVLDAEFTTMLNLFAIESLEYRVLMAVYRGKGNERPAEIADSLGVTVRELTKAKDNVREMLCQLNYFGMDGRPSTQPSGTKRPSARKGLVPRRSQGGSDVK